MVSNLQIFVVGVPVLIILGDEPQTSFFMKSAIVWMNDLVVVGIIFGNLIWSMYTSQNDAAFTSSQNIGEFVSKGINEYRDNVRPLPHRWNVFEREHRTPGGQTSAVLLKSIRGYPVKRRLAVDVVAFHNFLLCQHSFRVPKKFQVQAAL